jgi:hypothetical protein
MEEHPVQTKTAHRFVELRVAVALVARDRVAEMRRVHADLMSPASSDRDL